MNEHHNQMRYQRKRIEAVCKILSPLSRDPIGDTYLATEILTALDRLAHEDVDERLRDAFRLAAQSQ